VDCSCWETWRTSATLFSLPTQHLMLQCFAPLLCYSFFYSPNWNNKGKRYNKIVNSRPFWNAKFWEFYICRWICSQHNFHSYMKLLKYLWNKKIHLLSNIPNSDSKDVTSYVMLLNLLVNTICEELLVVLKSYYVK